jgi:hypothetical protein
MKSVEKLLHEEEVLAVFEGLWQAFSAFGDPVLTDSWV